MRSSNRPPGDGYFCSDLNEKAGAGVYGLAGGSLTVIEERSVVGRSEPHPTAASPSINIIASRPTRSSLTAKGLRISYEASHSAAMPSGALMLNPFT